MIGELLGLVLQMAAADGPQAKGPNGADVVPVSVQDRTVASQRKLESIKMEYGLTISEVMRIWGPYDSLTGSGFVFYNYKIDGGIEVTFATGDISPRSYIDQVRISYPDGTSKVVNLEPRK